MLGYTMTDTEVSDKKSVRELKAPPEKSGNILSELKYFFYRKPEIPTFVKINSEEERKRYSELFLNRTGVAVDNYRLLNIHRIAINTPAEFVFRELLTWNGDSIWWPNHIAKANLKNDDLQKIKITLFGLSHKFFKKRDGFFGFNLLHLFNLNAIKIQHEPDKDNGRLLLYKCSGGYPIGVFAMYVRDSNPELKEEGKAQLFVVVSFNFYGKKSLTNFNLLNKTWKLIHNRVTANIMQRIKDKCEWDYSHQIQPK